MRTVRHKQCQESAQGGTHEQAEDGIREGSTAGTRNWAEARSSECFFFGVGRIETMFWYDAICRTAFLLQVVRHRHRWHRKPSLNRPPRLRPRDTPPPRRPHPLLNKLRHLRVVRIRQRTSSLRMRWCKRCTSNYFEVSKVCWARSWDTRKFEKKRFPVGRFRKRAGVYGSVQEVGGAGWTALFSLLIVKPF